MNNSIQNSMHAETKITPLASLTDAMLMQCIQNGEQEKLGLLFERYKKKMYNFFMRLTRGESTLSEDLVQNTFLRILKYSNSYQPNKSFSTWLYQVARNVFYDQCKRKSNQEYSVEEFGHREPTTEMKPMIEDDNRLHLLRKSLKELSADKREIIVLSRYEGLQYKEIADILDCSENAVKVKAHRALKELKVIYSQLEKNQAI